MHRPQRYPVLPLVALATMAACIFCFSTGVFSASNTAQFFGEYNFYARKLAHISEYALLFLISRYALSKVLPNRSTAFHCAASLGFAALFAATDEWHQTFVPSRTGNVFDMYIDWSGAILGFILYTGHRALRSR